MHLILIFFKDFCHYSEGMVWKMDVNSWKVKFYLDVLELETFDIDSVRLDTFDAYLLYFMVVLRFCESHPTFLIGSTLLFVYVKHFYVLQYDLHFGNFKLHVIIIFHRIFVNE